MVAISGWFFNRNSHTMNAKQNLGRLRPDMTSITYNRRPHWFLNQNSSHNFEEFSTHLLFLKNSDPYCFWKNWIAMWLTFLQKQMVAEFFKIFNHNVWVTLWPEFQSKKQMRSPNETCSCTLYVKSPGRLDITCISHEILHQHENE